LLATCQRMNLATLLSTSRHRTLTTAQIMQLVIVAAVPGIIVMTWVFGIGVLFNIVWLTAVALAMEAAALACRGKNLRRGLGDYSAIVTALLLALSMPPASPWWLGVIGIFFAIVVAKQLYGGLGYNPFNPAMAGYAVLLISFPVEMTRWLLPVQMNAALPDLSALLAQFTGTSQESMDAYVGATALDQFKLERGGMTVEEYWQGNPLYGTFSGTGWEWINAAFLTGGLYMLYRKIITWHIPTAMLASLSLFALLFYDGGSSNSAGSPLFHLFGGAAMMGAFFIATDPVSGPATNRGKLIYGGLIGFLVYSIRVWGTYPDGVAFAVLLANFCAPAIDLFWRKPRSETIDAG